MCRSVSLEGHFWGGGCPECQDPQQEMLSNMDGDWECPNPDCRLVLNSGAEITVSREKGQGHFVLSSHLRPIYVSYAPISQVGRISHDLRA